MNIICHITGTPGSRAASRFDKWQPLPDLARFLFVNIALFFSARLALLSFLLPDISRKDHILHALYIGLKFDARWAVFLALPLALAWAWPRAERATASPGPSLIRRLLVGVETLLFGILALLYIFDFGFFFYLRRRIDMTAPTYIDDPAIALNMVWESYPVITLVLLFIAALALYAWWVRRLLIRHKTAYVGSAPFPDAPVVSRRRRALISLLGFAGLFLLGYGQISSNLFPLRWSNAYFSEDNAIATLALHPAQNLFDTRRGNEAVKPDCAAALAAYPRMAAWLGMTPRPITDCNDISYARLYVPSTPLPPERRPNIVIILMESMAWPKTSLAPAYPGENFVEPTPFLKELAAKSRYYPNFYSPSRPTARGVFNTLIGIPDVNFDGGTSSRNPHIVDQAVVFNELDGYEKFYNIGGSASWANVRGLIQHNVKGVQLKEEGAWKAPNIDVWGVADLELFKESVELFSASPKPFAAVIQTASFHRPYTIPEQRDGYEIPAAPTPEQIRYYGFDSVEEFQSLRFSDFSLRRFFEEAEKQPWFRNTIFAVFGDHGLYHASTFPAPAYQACSLQAWNTPLLLYAPGGQIRPGQDNTPHSQLDVFPTMAALTGIPFRSSTLGRDMLAPGNDENAMVFISEDITRMLIRDGYVYRNTPESLYRLDAPTLENLLEKEPERAGAMRQAMNDFYETVKFLLYNNGKARLDASKPQIIRLPPLAPPLMEESSPPAAAEEERTVP